MRIVTRARSAQFPAQPGPANDPLADAAVKAVKAAVAAEFNPDPLFPVDLSRLLSTAASIVKRHGPLIEDAIAAPLEQAGLIVQRNVALPVCRSSLAVVDSRDYEMLAQRQYAFEENDCVASVDVDLLVVDEANGWTTGMSVKRGGGMTDPRKRKANERLLRAAELTLASRLRQQGYRNVETAVVAVFDYLGQSGFSKDLAVTADAIDTFFGLPVARVIDSTTAAVRSAFDSEVRELLEPIARACGWDAAEHPSPIAPPANGITPRQARRRNAPVGVPQALSDPFPKDVIRVRQ